MTTSATSSSQVVVRVVAAGVLLLFACGPAAPDGAAEPAESPGRVDSATPGATQLHTPDSTGAVASVYECANDYRFSARLRGDSAYLALPAATVALGRSTASAGRYEGSGYTYTMHGGDASLVTEDGERDCSGRPARTPWVEAALLGIDFRAVGNEPGWKVEIDDERWLRYVGDYGATHVFVPASNVTIENDDTPATTYRGVAAARELVVVIREAACSDTMSGEQFTHTVSVRLDDAPALHGCGRAVEAVH